MSSFTSFSMPGTEEGERKTINYYIEINEVCEINLSLENVLVHIDSFALLQYLTFLYFSASKNHQRSNAEH